jgi:hypothetical protein
MFEHHSDSYEMIVKDLNADAARSPREREVERAFDASLPTVLERLGDETDDNRSAMLRRVNKQLRSDDEDAPGLSRGTMYNWIEKYADDERTEQHGEQER